MNCKIRRLLIMFGTIFPILVSCNYNELDSGDIVEVPIISSEYIDVSPALIEADSTYTHKSEFNRYMKAFSRFHAYVDTDGEKLLYKGPNHTELNISQQLFVYLKQGLRKTNNDIAEGKICLIQEDRQYKLVSSRLLGRRLKTSHVMLKTRGAETGGDFFKPGDLDGSEEEVGNSILNGMKQFFTNVNSEDSYYGYVGDYVNLSSYDWSQGNSMISGSFRFNEHFCEYTLVNLNAGMDNNIGYNELCTSDIVEDSINNIYQIKVIACYYSRPAMVITVYDYDTFQAMRRYLGH